MSISFQVNRTSIRERRIAEHEHRELAPGEVRMKVESFALTANNITYAAAGAPLGYWEFFPTELPWGHIPAMGYGEIIESANPDLVEGDRYFGFYPMASEHVLLATPTKDGMWDAGEHRNPHAPAYRQFTNLTNDPNHKPEHEAKVALLRGLFLTSYLAEDLLEDNGYFGADSTLVTSASSKTSIALGFCLQQRGTHAVGITSARNQEFVEGLGCYDQVITYDNVASLDGDRASVVVDMAGSAEVRASVHGHFGDNLKYSMAVGASHWEDLSFDAPTDLPGPTPEMFFAPGQIEKRNAELGPGVLMEQMGEQWDKYVDFADTWLNVAWGAGQDDLEAAYVATLEGSQPPNTGLMQSLDDR